MNSIAGRTRDAGTLLFSCLTRNIDELADPMWMIHIRNLFSSGNSAEMLRLGHEIQATHTDPVMLDQADHFIYYGTSGNCADSRLGLFHYENDTPEEWYEFCRNADDEYKERCVEEDYKEWLIKQNGDIIW